MLQTAFEEKIIKNFEKLSKQQLKEIFSREQADKSFLHTVLEAITYGIITVNKKSVIEYINTAGARFLQADIRKLIGKSINEIDTDPILKEKILHAIAGTEKVRQKEITLTRPKVAVVSLSSFPITQKGRISGFVFFISDVTDYFDEKVRQHQQESIKSLGILTAGVAHEIKNPLGSLDLHIQLINRFLNKSRFSGKSELKELVDVLDDELKRLDKIVNDFLFSVRPIKPILKKENINRVITDTIKIIKPELASKDITLDMDLAKDLPLIFLDKNYLKQAILNILKNSINAIDETDRPGTIKVITSSKKETVILTVADNGSGISKKNFNKIFEPFFSTKEMGTGLGLNIVYKIIHEHNGEIIISSEEHQGTEFRFEFKTHDVIPPLLSDQRNRRK